MTPEEIEQVANEVASKVIHDILGPKGYGMLGHFAEHELLGDALIVSEEKARATGCNCFTYDGRDYCFSKGAIGILTGNQAGEYCKVGKRYEVQPGIKERFEAFREAAEQAHKRIEHIPEGERLRPWWRAMGEELEKRGIEV